MSTSKILWSMQNKLELLKPFILNNRIHNSTVQIHKVQISTTLHFTEIENKTKKYMKLYYTPLNLNLHSTIYFTKQSINEDLLKIKTISIEINENISLFFLVLTESLLACFLTFLLCFLTCQQHHKLCPQVWLNPKNSWKKHSTFNSVTWHYKHPVKWPGIL